jgi:hypothetical protein
MIFCYIKIPVSNLRTARFDHPWMAWECTGLTGGSDGRWSMGVDDPCPHVQKHSL